MIPVMNVTMICNLPVRIFFNFWPVAILLHNSYVIAGSVDGDGERIHGMERRHLRNLIKPLIKLNGQLLNFELKMSWLIHGFSKGRRTWHAWCPVLGPPPLGSNESLASKYSIAAGTIRACPALSTSLVNVDFPLPSIFYFRRHRRILLITNLWGRAAWRLRHQIGIKGWKT